MQVPREFALALGWLVIGCGSGDLGGEWTEAMLYDTGPPCTGERAAIPRSGMVNRTVTPQNAETLRTPTADYVSYQVTKDEIFAYFSFAPSFDPNAPAVDPAAALDYAYVDFGLIQPSAYGGSLTLLTSSELLSSADFESFEIQNGMLHWRLVRQNAGVYRKWLTIYDDDPSNDPVPREACITGDIGGMCVCEFSGPPVAVAIEGTTPLAP